MSKDVVVGYEFDQCACTPNQVGHVFVRRNGSLGDEIVLKIEEKEHVIIRADRDQWGVFLTIGDIVVAQEDGTRSFLHGLIKCLNALSKDHECDTKPAALTRNFP